MAALFGCLGVWEVKIPPRSPQSIAASIPSCAQPALRIHDSVLHPRILASSRRPRAPQPAPEFPRVIGRRTPNLVRASLPAWVLRRWSWPGDAMQAKPALVNGRHAPMGPTSMTTKTPTPRRSPVEASKGGALAATGAKVARPHWPRPRTGC